MISITHLIYYQPIPPHLQLKLNQQMTLLQHQKLHRLIMMEMLISIHRRTTTVPISITQQQQIKQQQQSTN